MMTALPVLSHSLERTILIRARRETVFAFFTDNARWASWWGAGSTIDAHPGGRVYIRHPNGIEASGEVLEIAPPDRLVFSYGFDSGTPMPPGSSRVTITLAPDQGATRLNLAHELADATVRDEHVLGWRHQLSVFANAVADEVNAGAAAAADAWLASWSIADAGERERTLAAVADPAVTFRDRFSSVDGIAELVPHIGAAQRFMPGMRLQRKGNVRHCQGTVLADWVAVGPDGQERGSGTNVLVFDADGRITAVTGLWN
jgi:uncharacterized protein YndB with AHSA1/START domain